MNLMSHMREEQPRSAREGETEKKAEGGTLTN